MNIYTLLVLSLAERKIQSLTVASAIFAIPAEQLCSGRLRLAPLRTAGCRPYYVAAHAHSHRARTNARTRVRPRYPWHGFSWLAVLAPAAVRDALFRGSGRRTQHEIPGIRMEESKKPG